MQTAEEFTDSVLESARRYYSGDFPNEGRVGCPSPEHIAGIVDSGSMPDEEFREHLMSCSPCFTDFTERCRLRPMLMPTVKSERKAEAESGLKVLGVAAAVIFTLSVAVGSLVLTSSNDRPATDPATDIQSATPSTEDVSTVEATAEPAGGQDAPVRDGLGESEVKNFPEPRATLDLDIARLSVRRGNGSAEKSIEVAAAKQRVVVRLVAGSPPGIYNIFLLDEFGEPVGTAVAVKSDGRRLKADLDLSRTTGAARLCIGYGEEVPDCFSVFIKK